MLNSCQYSLLSAGSVSPSISALSHIYPSLQSAHSLQPKVEHLSSSTLKHELPVTSHASVHNPNPTLLSLLMSSPAKPSSSGCVQSSGIVSPLKSHFVAPVCVHSSCTCQPHPFGPIVVQVIPDNIFECPPCRAAETAIAALNVEYAAQLSSMWRQLKSWCVDNCFEFLTGPVLNEFIAVVSTSYSSLSHASRARATSSWVAAMVSASRPCDAMTWKLMKAMEKVYKSGGRFLLTEVDFGRLRSAGKADKHPARFLCLVCLTGIRPCELCLLSQANFMLVGTCPVLFIGPTKYRPAGRSIDLSPLAVSVIKDILATIGNDPLLPNTKQALKDLKQALRRILASDPVSLPMLSLYSCRHFFCTVSYQRGASSAWLMRQMGHRNWSTTCSYIHLPNEEETPQWRDSFIGKPDDPLLPLSAVQAPLLQHPTTTKNFLAKKFKSKADYVQLVEDDALEACVDGVL